MSYYTCTYVHNYKININIIITWLKTQNSNSYLYVMKSDIFTHVVCTATS